MAQEVKFDTTVVPGKIVWSISETISNLKLSCEGVGFTFHWEQEPGKSWTGISCAEWWE